MIVAHLLPPLLAAVAEPDEIAPDEAAAEAEAIEWGAILQFELVGVIIVLGTLTLLWLLCECIGFLFKRAAAAAERRAAATAAAQAPPPAPADDADEIPVAAIAAAVAYALEQRPHRIVAIGAGTSNWSAEGRREHFLSHRVR